MSTTSGSCRRERVQGSERISVFRINLNARQVARQQEYPHDEVYQRPQTPARIRRSISTLSLPSSLSAGPTFPDSSCSRETAPIEPGTRRTLNEHTYHPTFTDEASEFTAIQATPSPIDFTTGHWIQHNWASNCKPNFQVTPPISDAGYFELQFHMDRTSGAAVQLRQSSVALISAGFAHGLDKTFSYPMN